MGLMTGVLITGGGAYNWGAYNGGGLITRGSL